MPTICGARITQPVWPVQWIGIEGGVVFRKVGIARVAENAFDEIEIAHQAGGREKRVSMVLAGDFPPAGETSGRSSRLTKKRACSGWSAVKGRASTSSGGRSAAAQQPQRTPLSGRRSCRREPGNRLRRCGKFPAWCGGRSSDYAEVPAAADKTSDTATTWKSASGGNDMARARPGRSSVKASAGSLRRWFTEVGIEKLLNAQSAGQRRPPSNWSFWW